MGNREVNAAAHGTALQNSFSKEDWEKTPEVVSASIPRLHQRIDAHDQTIHRLIQRIDDLEARTKRNSSNSNQPPSSDPPYKKNPKTSQRTKSPVAKKVTRGIGKSC
jgi:hypothetical protein